MENHTKFNQIAKYQILHTTLTGQFVHASQSLQGLRHRFQKLLLHLLRHVQKRASPGLSMFPRLLDFTLVLFCIFFRLVSVFGFQKRTTKFSLTLPAWSRTSMEAYCTDLVEMLSHQGLYLGKSQSRERPYWSPWWHPHLDLNCKICVSSRRYIDKLRTVGNECMDINIRTYRKVIHKIPYEKVEK